MNTKRRKTTLILMSLLLLLSSVYLYPNPTMGQESVVSSFSSPGTDPHGLAWDGDYLWNADNDDDKIYKINPSTGAVVDSIPSPGTDSQGLAWDGNYLWNADNDDNKIYKLNPSTGAVIDSFSSPGPNPYGLAWDGDYLWHDDSTDDKIYKLNPSTGAVIDFVSSPGRQPRGLAWDGDYMWHCDSTDDKIYKLDISGPSVVAFSVSVSQSSKEVVRGNAVNFSISVDWTSGTPETVTLSVSGIPEGCSAAFSPKSGTSDFTSTLIVATTETATLGTHILRITGESSGGETRTTTVTLVIREYEPTILETVRDLVTNPTVLAAVIGFIGSVITAIVAIMKLRGRKKSD